MQNAELRLSGYETMFTLIKDMFVDCNEVIEAKEIEDSYCPGSYDLSIQGEKIRWYFSA